MITVLFAEYMKEIQYKAFSLRTHKENWRIKRPNVCQFELTFKCGLRCRHCYTDCYNEEGDIKRELTTNQVKLLIDKAYQAGVIWLCFTGGDPLTRQDFLELYSYAKAQGFLITIFTNAYSMAKELIKYLKKRPPFAIEMTLNAVTKEPYEKISQVEGSFEKVMQGVNLILKAKLPLKIKTQITKDNAGGIHDIKKFIEGLGLKFRPSYNLFARLNGDLRPCNLRISPEEVLNLNGRNQKSDDDCANRLAVSGYRRPPHTAHRTPQTDLFHCAIGGGDGLYIDPYGNTFPCELIRKPVFNLLKVDVDYALGKLLPIVRNKKFTTDSKCNGCNLREGCHWCPGRAYVEKGDIEAPIEYYCKLAKLFHSR